MLCTGCGPQPRQEQTRAQAEATFDRCIDVARIGEGFGAVLGAARVGEAWAFQRLFESIATSLTGYLRGNGCQNIDDVANEVLLGAFRGIGGFEGDEDRFRSWVFTIAHRRLIDERRQLRRQPDAAELDDDAVGGDSELEALTRLSDQRVTDLLAGLTEDQRDVLLLRIVADLSIEETGRLLRKPVTAVKALQRRGLDALRREISTEAVSR